MYYLSVKFPPGHKTCAFSYHHNGFITSGALGQMHVRTLTVIVHWCAQVQQLLSSHYGYYREGMVCCMKMYICID